MSLLKRSRRVILSLLLALVLVTNVACASATQTTADRPALTAPFEQIELGNTASGQNFGEWITQTAQGLIQDAYVRDNDKLGVVITPQVRPTELRSLSRSLVEGFRKNFPNRDLKVLVYAPDRQLVLTAKYNNQTHQIEYEGNGA